MKKLLKDLNAFNQIIFKDQEHTYWIGDRKIPRSATAYINDLIPKEAKFDTEDVSKRYAEKHGLNQQDVKDDWKRKGKIGAERGTLLHYFVENYAEGKNLNLETKFTEVRVPLSKSCELFKLWWSQHKDRYVPIKAEWVIYDKDLDVAGQIDRVFYNLLTEQYEIWDWKTNKEIKYGERWDPRFLGGFSNFPICEFNKFSIQTSLYKLILQRNTSLNLGPSYIGWLNENLKEMEVIKLDDMTSAIELHEDYFKEA